MSLIPSFKWAEDNQKIYLTIELPNARNATFKLAEKSLDFTADAADNTTNTKSSPAHRYELHLEFLHSINVDKSTHVVKARDIEIIFVKGDDNQEYWNRLLSDKNAYKGHMKIDWDLWRDEDAEDEPVNNGMNDFGAGGMNFPGMNFGDMANMNFGGDEMDDHDGHDDHDHDSDDDDVPELDDNQKPVETTTS